MDPSKENEDVLMGFKAPRAYRDDVKKAIREAGYVTVSEFLRAMCRKGMEEIEATKKQPSSAA